MQLRVDDTAVEADAEHSLLIHLLRHGLHPTGGGCLCLAGDCPHCLVSVDGVGYVRSCQVTPREAMRVTRHHHDGGQPPLVGAAGSSSRRATANRHRHCDVVVIGHGASGRAEAERAREGGKAVVVLDAADGQEVIGIYPGPLVVARTEEGKLQLHPRDEIVVATGAAEIQPVVPGSRLAGLVASRAAPQLAQAGLDLGRVVAVGRPPDGLAATRAEGELLRFEGDDRVRAVVVRGTDGAERRHPCDTVSIGLGFQPRDALLRMGRGLPVRAVGRAARPSDIPRCPASGTVCPCAGVTVDDLESVWERGFRRLELVKRATLAGTGTCQGSICIPYLRSFLEDRGQELEPPFTARPMTRQLTLGEIAAGAHHRPTPRTPLHDEHVALGARMDRIGGWWRPWSYGDAEAEYRAVRQAVSIGDVSPLGKFRLSGPDATALLELLYPTRLAGLAVGRSRYALLLDERGYVLDDGLVCRDGEERYTVTLTSAGAGFGELWMRDWIDARGFDVRLLDQTVSLGAINVTGPRAAELLARAAASELPAFAAHLDGEVAGIACRIYRLSFTGELSYELHHAAADSVALWRRLLALGRDLGIRPHGLQALLDLRLEKGHIVVGKDTDFDSTPRRIDHGWAVAPDKGEFVGRQAVLRTDRRPLDRQLVGLEMEPRAPHGRAGVGHGEA
ncbi:MAG: 2Fe-2S iron-sulfur cluster-binding protein [Thermoanaerobaculia bacterium]|nr:2Fe-2S iron-sulfur cluster-binding protein [Thermoanaerobaculia bacterium]